LLTARKEPVRMLENAKGNVLNLKAFIHEPVDAIF
jgi:hypothetical protein